MSKTRLHCAIAIVGKKGCGKSTKLAELALNYPADRKVLIMDVNGSPAYNQFQKVDVNDIKRLKKGKVRLMGTPTEETLNIIARDFRDGLLIAEDCTKYIENSPTKAVKTLLVDHRMLGCDLVFTFHAIKFIPPFFWQMLSHVMICKTMENVDTARNRNVIPNADEIIAAYLRVKASKDAYYCETVETYI
ncbi:MAG: hypothetical protein H7Y13_02370 [Sphingobacteriaceae bacterium]|nr:hypothetical protein [Sphingobacteriaceae bacterium]